MKVLLLTNDVNHMFVTVCINVSCQIRYSSRLSNVCDACGTLAYVAITLL
jgi:hypothetical protein